MLNRIHDIGTDDHAARPRRPLRRRLIKAVFPLAVAGGMLFAGAASASADTVPAIPPVTVTPPNVSANPTAQTDVCGNGVGVFGSGTSSSCASPQSSTASSSDGSGVDVSPNAATGVCGTGVGLFGTGTTSNCDNAPVAAARAGGDPVSTSPATQSDVCGNGAGVFGTGSSSTCDPATSAGTTSATPTAPNSDSPGSVTFASSMFDGRGSAATPATANPLASSGGLAFTGAGVEITSVIGSALAAIGALLLRARRLV